MSYSGAGVYTLPEADFVAGTLIRSADMNSDLGDIESALTSAGQWTVNPNITMTAVPSNVYVGGPTFSLLALTETNLNAGTNTLYGRAIDFVYGGGFGGRVADLVILAQTTASNAANTAPYYVARQSTMSTLSGDGGTNTGAGAKGDYSGGADSVNIFTGALNVEYATGHQSTPTLFLGSTTKDVAAYHAQIEVGASVSCRPARMFHGYTLSFATTVSINHLNYAYAISDLFGSTPVGPQTVALFGSQFATVTTPVSVSSGVKLTDFTFAGNAFSSTGFAVSGTGAVTLNAHSTAAVSLSITTTSGNNLALTSGFLRLTSGGAFDVTGFVAQADGYVLRVYNTTANNMNIINQATSSAANQITTMTGATVSTTATGFATFVYDVATTKWLLTAVQA